MRRALNTALTDQDSFPPRFLPRLLPIPFSSGIAYKTALLASSNGVHGLVTVRAPLDAEAQRCAVYVGGGDGSLRCFVGQGLDWVCTAEARLQGRVTSLSICGGAGTWMLARTSEGLLYRVSFGGALHQGARGGGRAAVDLLEVSHTGPVLAAAFHPSVASAVATVSADQTVRLWNLNTYGVSWAAALPSGVHPTVLWVAEPTEGAPGFGHPRGGGQDAPSATSAATGPSPGVPCDVYCGFNDGSLRAYAVNAATVAAAAAQLRTSGSGAITASVHGTGGSGGGSGGGGGGGGGPSGGGASGGQLLESWRAAAHRGPVLCMTGNRAVVVTGGPDGRVNVWARRSHDLLLSFNDHAKPLVAVRIDCANPEVLYSVGQDRVINTYSLRAERRLRLHAMPQAEASACAFVGLTQLTSGESERELLAAASDGRIFLYDPAVPEVSVGVVDVLALLVQRAKAQAAPGALAVQGETPEALVPRLRPGQTRANLRISGMATSPSGRFIAVSTHCGRLVVLALPPPGAGAGMGATAGAGAVPRLPTFVDHSGKPRTAITSPASAMAIVAFHYGGRATCYTDVQWAPDERQLVLTSVDACISVVNVSRALRGRARAHVRNRNSSCPPPLMPDRNHSSNPSQCSSTDDREAVCGLAIAIAVFTVPAAHMLSGATSLAATAQARARSAPT